MTTIDPALFSQFLSLVESMAGMAPPVSHQNHIRRELLKLQSRWGMEAPVLLEAIRTREDVRQEFLNSVTINETYFFREQRHFDFLRSTVLPQLSGQDRQLNFWSVSCSTGEEAVSLAVLAADYMAAHPGALGKGFAVHASDINAEVLAQFRTGEFSLRSFRQDGSDYHGLLRTYGSTQGEPATGIFKLNPELLSNIHIFGVNVCGQEVLGDGDDDLPEMVDVIFFRNTLLYMAMEKRPVIIDSLVQRMSPGGWLFLSSSEVAFVEHNELESIEHGGLYCFRKPQHTVRQTAPAKKSALLPQSQGSFAQPSRPPAPRASDNLHEQIVTVLESIHTGRVGDVEQRLKELSKVGLESFIESFLLGQLYRTREQMGAAAIQFARSFDLNPRFWPGRFYYALCIKDSNPQAALMEFRAIAGGESKADRDKTHKIDREYDYLLDGFDPGLFKQIAQNWIVRLLGDDSAIRNVDMKLGALRGEPPQEGVVKDKDR